MVFGVCRKSEGHACRARQNGMDIRTWRSGRDKHVPPKGGADTQVSPASRYDLLNSRASFDLAGSGVSVNSMGIIQRAKDL